MKFRRIAAALISVVLISSVACNKETAKQINKTDESEEEVTEDVTEESSESTTAESSVEIVESNINSDEDAPIVVDWNNYQESEKEYVFTRLSEDALSFEPSEDYGAVFPFWASSEELTYYFGEHDHDESDGEYYYVPEDDADPYTGYSDDTFGFCDSQGRIVCDPIFSDVKIIPEYPVYIVKTGHYPDEKYGLISVDGTKYVAPEYDRIDCDDEGLYAASGNSLTVYDLELNVVKQTSIVWSKEHEDMIILGIIDDSHCLAGFSGPAYYGCVGIYDYKSGKMLEQVFDDFSVLLYIYEVYDDRQFFIDGESNLIDKNGKRVFDESESVVLCPDTTFCPFIKNGDVCQAIDSNGEVIIEIPLVSERHYESGDYLLLNTSENTWTMFDRDFNMIGSFESDWEISAEDWSNYSLKQHPYLFYMDSFWSDMKEPDVPYVVDEGNIINALTGEVVFEDIEPQYTLLVCNDLVAAFGNGKITFSNGNVYEESYTKLTTDWGEKTPYVINCLADQVQVYDPTNNTTCVVDLKVSEDNEVYVGGGSLYCQNGDVSYVYDISDPDDPQLVFKYKCVDPLGE